MTYHNPEYEPTWHEVVSEERAEKKLGELSIRDLAQKLKLNAEGGITYEAALKVEAAERLARFDRLTRLLGLLAPAGTAPRTAIEQIYVQSESNAEESPVILDLRAMLTEHWGEWTPALREAEGLPPTSSE